MKKLAILVDSGSTINNDYYTKNDIYVIPLSISDSKNKVYRDIPEEITPEYVFSEIEKGNSFKTSCTAMGVIMAKVEDLLKSFEHIIMIPISEGLSGQYNACKNIEKEFEGKFVVAKSTSGAFANEYVAKLVREFSDKYPNASLSEIVNYANSLYIYTATYFSCEDPSGLAKSGRATKAIVKVFEVLKLKPLICLDFKNHLAGIGKNYKTILEKLFKCLKKDFGDDLMKPNFIKEMCVYLGGFDDEKKNFLVNKFSQELNFLKEKIQLRWVPTCVLTHTLKGSYGVTICCKEPHKVRKHKD